jgi:hypothetical protein
MKKALVAAASAAALSCLLAACSGGQGNSSTPTADAWGAFRAAAALEEDPPSSLDEARAVSTHTVVGEIVDAQPGKTYVDGAGGSTKTANLTIQASAPDTQKYVVEMVLEPTATVPASGELPQGEYLFFIFPGYTTSTGTVYGCLSQGWCGISAVGGAWRSSTDGEVTSTIDDEAVVPLDSFAK